VRPLIGISSWRGPAVDDGLEVPSLISHASYARALEKAGALTVVLPELAPDDAEALLDRIDGVVIVGGPDVGDDEQRDAFDLALARHCVERDFPLLAICRGIQVLNVALGGTLVQHIDDHMVRDKWNETVHYVDIEPGTRLAATVGTTRLAVNSLHHQAVDRFGDNVRAIAHAEDGTVEAIEVAGAANVSGIQWHAELLRHRPDHLALFEALVSRASG
jgi:putative glutamine amidotransferase